MTTVIAFLLGAAFGVLALLALALLAVAGADTSVMFDSSCCCPDKLEPLDDDVTGAAV